MHSSSMHYFPLGWPFILALFLLFLFVVVLVELGIIRYAYERMGIPSRYVMGIFLLSLLGSAINISVVELPPHEVVSGGLINFYGVQYVVRSFSRGQEQARPAAQTHGTLLAAVNPCAGPVSSRLQLARPCWELYPPFYPAIYADRIPGFCTLVPYN